MTHTKRAIAAKMLRDANIHLIGYGNFSDPALNVARNLLHEAERRVRNGFGPVPAQDADNFLEVERKYTRIPTISVEQCVREVADVLTGKRTVREINESNR